MNAELRRNLWLELSVHRVIALPVALGLVLMLVHAMSGPGAPLATTSATLFVVFALWGAVHAGDAVVGEVRARTWDGQRMSAIGPWEMTWGKLLGSPAFAWYGCALCLAAYLVTSPESDAVQTALFLVSGAITLHAVTFIVGMIAARKAVVRSSSSGWVLALLVLGAGPWVSGLSSGEATVSWWAHGWRRMDFLVASGAIFAAWGVLGAHRLMCQELRVRTTPWAWISFLLFVSVYIAGLGIRPQDTLNQKAGVVLIAGLIVSLFMMYPLLFTEGTGAMTLRRITLRISERDWRRLFEEAPLWPLTLGMAIVFCVLTVLVTGSRGPSGPVFNSAGLAPVPLLLLAMRDAGLYVFFAAARQPRRVETATLFYLVLLYWLIPMLLRAVDAPLLADLVLPPFWERPGYATAIIGAQAAAIIAMAVWRWRRNRSIFPSQATVSTHAAH